MGGSQPHLCVLGFGTLDTKRSPSDLLPYLPKFRSMFTKLPKNAEEVKSAVINVNLEEVECVTTASVKVRGPPLCLQVRKVTDEHHQTSVIAMLKLDPVQKRLAEEEFTTKYCNWEIADWNELEWDKVKDLQVRDLLAERQKMAQIAQQAQCLRCPNFLKHVGYWDYNWLKDKSD